MLRTRLGIVGDPCQMKASIRTLKCTASLHNSCDLGLSAVNWILNLLVAEEPAAMDFVARVDLLNRSKTSQRCRALACEAVNRLSPLCLPGTARFWQTLVSGQKVWSDLRPNESLTSLERFLAAKTSEVVSIQTRHRSEHPTSEVAMTGYQGKSRYDVDVALYAAMAAVVVGVEQVGLRRSYDLAEWSTHFPSVEAAELWVHKRVRVTIVAAYTAMVELTREAVAFVKELNASSPLNSEIEVSCVSADAIQGVKHWII